jgi:hypothetical protein
MADSVGCLRGCRLMDVPGLLQRVNVKEPDNAECVGIRGTCCDMRFWQRGGDSSVFGLELSSSLHRHCQPAPIGQMATAGPRSNCFVCYGRQRHEKNAIRLQRGHTGGRWSP